MISKKIKTLNKNGQENLYLNHPYKTYGFQILLQQIIPAYSANNKYPTITTMKKQKRKQKESKLNKSLLLLVQQKGTLSIQWNPPSLEKN